MPNRWQIRVRPWKRTWTLDDCCRIEHGRLVDDDDLGFDLDGFGNDDNMHIDIACGDTPDKKNDERGECDVDVYEKTAAWRPYHKARKKFLPCLALPCTNLCTKKFPESLGMLPSVFFTYAVVPIGL